MFGGGSKIRINFELVVYPILFRNDPLATNDELGSGAQGVAEGEVPTARIPVCTCSGCPKEKSFSKCCWDDKVAATLCHGKCTLKKKNMNKCFPFHPQKKI